jgi:hypothetical protein
MTIPGHRTNDKETAAPSQKKNSILWLGFYVLYSIAVLYCVFTYTGPGRWIGELQLRTFGWNSGAITLIALLIPVVVLMRTVGGTSPTEPFFELLSRFRLERLAWPAVVLLIGGIVANIVAQKAFSPNRGRLSVLQAIDGDGAFYATVHGHLMEGITVQKGSSIPDVYLPLMDPEQDENTGSFLVVQIRETLLDTLKQDESGFVEVAGFVDERLAGEIRAWLEQKIGRPINSVRVIHSGVSPEKAKIFFWILIVISIFTAGIIGFRKFKRFSTDYRS